MNITHIIWDYNGTVLDDTDVSVNAVNKMLLKRGLPPTDRKAYTDTVSLPLEEYYKSIGIHDADMHRLSVEFRHYCQEDENGGHIFDDFYDAINYCRHSGISNILMSSLYSRFLDEELEKYGIRCLFDNVIGMNDTGVGSKLGNAKQFIEQNTINPANVLFIGDLVPDALTAFSLGARCVLIPRGHNSKDRCKKTGADILENLAQLKEYLQRA